MIIDVIVCSTDGTQEIEQREVAENWFDSTEVAQPETAE